MSEFSARDCQPTRCTSCREDIPDHEPTRSCSHPLCEERNLCGECAVECRDCGHTVCMEHSMPVGRYESRQCVACELLDLLADEVLELEVAA